MTYLVWMPKSVNFSREHRRVLAANMRAREGKVCAFSRGLGASILYLPRGCFRYERPWLKDEGRRTSEARNREAEATQQNPRMQTRMGVVRGWNPKERG